MCIYSAINGATMCFKYVFIKFLIFHSQCFTLQLSSYSLNRTQPREHLLYIILILCNLSTLSIHTVLHTAASLPQILQVLQQSHLH